MRWPRFVAAGAVGGLVGASLSLVWLVIYAVFAGQLAWAPLVRDATVVMGQAVYGMSLTGRIALGVAAHFFSGAVLGAVFGALSICFLGEAPTRYSAWGFVYGTVLWLLSSTGWLAPTTRSVAPWATAVALLLFGSFAGSYVGSTAGEAVREGRL